MIEIGPYQNRQRRTCLVVGNSKTSVDVIMLETVSGLRVTQMTETAFNKEFKPINGYPLHKAIEQYIEFAIYCGMSDDVRETFTNMLEGIGKKGTDVSLALAKLDQVPASKVKEETAKKTRSKKQSSSEDDLPWHDDDQPSSNKTEKKNAKAVSGKTSKDLSEKRGKTTPPEKPTKEDKKAMPAKRTTKVPQQSSSKNTDSIKVGRQSAAQMFRDLILAGSYDDDKIFAMVQQEFGLDDSKRNYVSYYRRELKQKGLI